MSRLNADARFYRANSRKTVKQKIAAATAGVGIACLGVVAVSLSGGTVATDHVEKQIKTAPRAAVVDTGQTLQVPENWNKPKEKKRITIPTQQPVTETEEEIDTTETETTTSNSTEEETTTETTQAAEEPTETTPPAPAPEENSEAGELSPPPAINANGSTNILIMGTDVRPGEDDYGRSDTTFLVSVNKNRDHATVMSIPRDTMIPTPDCKDETGAIRKGKHDGELEQFNATMSRGGPGCTVSSVEYLTGTHIDHFAVINFQAAEQLVDQIGGVPIHLEEPLVDDKVDLDLQAGDHVLNGHEALGFARSRYGRGGGDLKRIDGQHQLLAAIVKKLKESDILTSPTELSKLSGSVLDNLTVDPELGSIQNISNLALDLSSVPTGNITFTTMPVQPWEEDQNRLVPVWGEANAMFDELKK